MTRTIVKRSVLAVFLAEIARIVWSRQRVLPRSGRLIAATLRRVPVAAVVSIGAVPVLVGLVLSGDLDRAWKSLSGVEILALAVVATLVLRLLGRRRSVLILPFRGVVTDDKDRGDNKDGRERTTFVDGVASAFGEELNSELHRIQALVRRDDVVDPPVIRSSALDDRSGPVMSRLSGEEFGRLSTETGAQLDVAAADAGTLNLGPLRLPVALVANLVARLSRRTIRGRIIDGGNVIRVVVTLPGRNGASEMVERPKSADDKHPSARPLARELAYLIVWRNMPEPPIGANSYSFRCVLEGLEWFAAYERHGGLDDLASAERSFLAATRHSPDYTAAFYNLGVVQYERWRIYRDLQIGVPVTISAALTSWQRALQLDPDFIDARLQLERRAEDHDETMKDPNERIERLNALVRSLSPKQKQYIDARYLLGRFRYELAMRTDEDALLTHAEGALEHLRIAEHGLRDQLGCDRIAGRSMRSLFRLRDQLTIVLTNEGDLHLRLAFAAASDREERRRLKAAERAYRDAVELRPETSAAREGYGATLWRRGKRQEGFRELLTALEIDSFRGGVVETLDNLNASREAVVTLCRIKLITEPEDAYPWRRLADHASATQDGDDNDVKALRGRAMILSPRDYYPDPGGLTREVGDWLRQWRGEWSRARGVETARDVAELADVIQRIDGLHQRVPAEALAYVRLADHELGMLRVNLLVLEGTWSAPMCRQHGDRALDLLKAACAEPLPLSLPVPPLWLIELAELYADLGRPTEALEVYDKVLEDRHLLDPLTFFHHKGSITFDAKIAASPLWARARAGRAAVYLNTGRYIDSMRDCMEAIRAEPSYPYPYSVLAELYQRRGQYEQAEETLRSVVELIPASLVEVHQRLGNLYQVRAKDSHDVAEGRRWRERAVAEFREALARDPDVTEDVAIRASLAETLTDLGRTDEAISEYALAGQLAKDAGDRLRPQLADIHAQRADLCTRQRAFVEAERELRGLLKCVAAEVDVRDRDARWRAAGAENALAWFLVEQWIRLDEAVELATQAIEHAQHIEDDQDPVAHDLLAMCLDTRGWAYFRLGRTQEAIMDLERAVAKAPNAERWAHLATALAAQCSLPPDTGQRDAERARAIWSHIIERYPNSPFAAKARERQGAATESAAD